ncbi:MAG: HlyC/CorC family transporter [Eubacterium sp.]|nr:HlyC/CorC family transporter [Eubacterium sp.]
MDTGDAIRLLALIILVILSSFFSSSETALTTVSKIRMRTLAENGDKHAKIVLSVTSDTGKMLSAILIGNNIVNLSASSIATTLALKLFGSMGAGIATGLLTLIILIFGEISPKTYASIYADKIALKFAPFFKTYILILTPVIFIINILAHGFLRLFRVNPKDAVPAITEDELKTIVDVSHENGIIESEEREMIQNVFDFGDALAKEIMIPRIDMECISIDNTYEEIIQIFRENKFTRLPVYENTTDNVVGILNMKDLLLAEDTTHFSIRSFLREAYFTYEHKKLAELFIEMRKNSINMTIVLDEYGSTAGLITLEDLLEEIVGEIRDEFDFDEEDTLTRIGDGEYLVLGSMNLEDLGDALDAPLASEDYDSVGGYLLEQLGHLPKIGESITTESGIFLRVEKMDKNRIEKMYLRMPEQENQEENEEESCVKQK